MEKHIYSFILHDIILFLGLELEEDGEPAIENAPCYKNSYWKGDGMEIQRGARGIYG